MIFPESCGTPKTFCGRQYYDSQEVAVETATALVRQGIEAKVEDEKCPRCEYWHIRINGIRV